MDTTKLLTHVDVAGLRRARPVPGQDAALRAFAKEVLRTKATGRDAIHALGAAFFARPPADLVARVSQLRASAGEAPAASPPLAAAPVVDSFASADELHQRISNMFRASDRNGDGVLDRSEVTAVVRRFGRELGLSSGDVRQVLSVSDENADGVIEYAEFVPAAVAVLQAISATRAYRLQREDRGSRAGAAAESTLLHGLTRETMEASLRGMFDRADVDVDGTLSRKEFVQALRGSGIGLSRHEVNLLLAEADVDRDGRISWREWLPIGASLAEGEG